MSNKTKKSKNEPVQKNEEKEGSQLPATMTLLYFLLAFGFTAFATDHQLFTYGQIAIVYLPMFFIFIYWQVERIKEVRADGGHTRFGNYVAIGLCIFIIIATLCITIGTWTGLLAR